MSDLLHSPELLGIYVEDARAHLAALDRCLLALEREGLASAHVEDVLGPLHTLKGNSGMMGFDAIKDYVHRLEDVFEQVRAGRLSPDAELCDALLGGAGALREAVEAASRGGHESQDLLAEQAVLQALLRRPVGRAPASESQAESARPAPPAGAGDVAAAEPRPRQAAEAAAARSGIVRVDFAQLDHLLNLVGELIIHRTKLHQAGRSLAEAMGTSQAGRDLVDAVQQLERVSAELQATVMDVRMLPMRHVFERFPRLVRDLARSQGKDVELILEGEGTRVDKAVIDEIAEPLVHMIRNSVDHGIEMPAQRAARGKTPTGTILLSAAQESNQVVLTIMDDGAGIDATEVRRKALEHGLLKGHETLSDREAVQLIFAPGFSTAEAVTDVSGRGVGLDVVLRSIERLNGLVEVETMPGVGTRFIIQLPLTLAIIAALLVETEGVRYAVPLPAVVESLKFEARDVRGIGGRPTLDIRNRIVPLLDLAGQLGSTRGTKATERRYAVVLGRGEKRVALAVDALRGQQEVVIKALDPAVKTPAIAGATIMGDGRVVLILDVAAFFEGRRHGLGAERTGRTQVEA
jgi:two-component system chemotaxis sensor kinase CheA